MATGRPKKERHFPNWSQDNAVRRLFTSPTKHCAQVKPDQVVADLGCGPGFYTLPLAECVGPGGRVYAVDTYERAILALKKRAAKRGLHNIEARTCSAADVGFIADESVDFVLADGLLCSVAPEEHEPAVGEIKRILKPDGKAYLMAARGPSTNVDDEEWESILEGFVVHRRDRRSRFQDRWALVSKRSP